MTDLSTLTDAVVLTLLALFVFLSGCAPKPRTWQGLFTSEGIGFSDRDRETIRDFYSRYEFPPELSNPAVLDHAPGKRIERSAVLPPGPGGAPLPADLESRLSELPPGYVRFRSGSDVVLMDSRTREVLDVIHDVLP